MFFSERNFFGQLGHNNLEGLLKANDDEEIKEHKAMCLFKQIPLCLKEAEQNGQLNIVGMKEKQEKNKKILRDDDDI